ncbi:hypothetical protein F5Y10DRAFT_264203 [Nemania abortiva]|nr:hypothetical protein F5Y10DRAFT_264203 [Nemania abortiva]
MAGPTSVSSSQATSIRIEKVRDVVINLSTKIFTVGHMEQQQVRDHDCGPLEESAITGPSHCGLDSGTIRKAAHAFAVVFNFDGSGKQVTAAMMGETRQELNKTCKVTIYIAKNGGTATEDNNLRKALLHYFNELPNGMISKKKRKLIFRLCSRKTKTDIRQYREEPLRLALHALRRWPKEDASIRPIANGIARLLQGILNCYSEAKVLQKQSSLLGRIWSWMEKNKTNLGIFRGMLLESPDLGESDINNVNNCLYLLEDLCRLHRALKEFENLKSKLLKTKTTVSIYFVRPQPSNARYIDKAVREQLDSSRLSNTTAVPLPLPPNALGTLPDIHCEVQLLTHFYGLSTNKKSNMWSYIACSKLPCFCCYHILDKDGHFKTEQSHCRVYSSWRVPKKLETTARAQLTTGPSSNIVNALRYLREKLDIRIDRAYAGHSWEEGEALCQNPRDIYII